MRLKRFDCKQGRHVFGNNRGVALLIALLISVAVMAMVAGVLYFVTQSTSMSGAGKRYATASEAADGAVQVVKNTIFLTINGDTAPQIFCAAANCGTVTDTTVTPNNITFTDAYTCLTTAVVNQGQSCATAITLPGISGSYTANVTVTRLYSVSIPGGRLEFARSAGGAPSTAVFYRITTRVVNTSDNTTAENSALYRLTN